MKISIITVNLNEPRFERCLRSIRDQTHKDIEHIVIDGGSTDGFKEVVAKYGDRISVLVSEKDNGIYNGMNKGLKYCTGDYVIIMNSSDHFHNNKSIEDAVKVMKRFPGYGFYHGDKLNHSKNPLKHWVVRSDKAKLFPLGLVHNATFVKTGIAKEIGYDEKYKIAADRIFFYHLASKTDGKKLEMIVSDYYRDGVSFTDTFNIHKDIKQAYEEFGIKFAGWRKVL